LARRAASPAPRHVESRVEKKAVQEVQNKENVPSNRQSSDRRQEAVQQMYEKLRTHVDTSMTHFEREVELLKMIEADLSAPPENYSKELKAAFDRKLELATEMHRAVAQFTREIA
jgi:hypothetical protein